MATKKAKKIRVELVKGLAATLPSQRATVKALGLNKINSYAILDDTPVTRGMVKSIEHMLKVTEVK